jgi:hypothetical protein
MAANFAASIDFSDPSVLVLEDTSTGIGAFTDRIAYLELHDGDYLVPSGTATDFVDWDAAASTVDIDCCDKDYSLNIKVDWLNGSTIAYTKTILYTFTVRGDIFLNNLTQYQTANPKLINSRNFFENKSKLRELLDSAAQATEQGSDQSAAQLCLDTAKAMMDKPKIFY